MSSELTNRLPSGSSHDDPHSAWERAAASYRVLRGDDVAAVQYGSLAPAESQLHLLGKLAGQRVLDVGCGGGNNAIACAAAGAEVAALDFSTSQLGAAQALAARAGVEVAWHLASVEQAPEIAGSGYDLVLATQVLPYVANLPKALAALRATVQPQGRVVISLDHPLRNCFYDAELGELSGYPVRSYFDTAPLHWLLDGVPLWSHHLPLSGWLDAMQWAGLHLVRLVELPALADVMDELWPEDSALAPLRAIPHTAIFVLSPTVARAEEG